MSKRSVGRAGQKGTAARKRHPAKDLAAKETRGVVGGLLPAVKPSWQASGHVKVFNGSAGSLD
jgi:hypothetical protein